MSQNADRIILSFIGDRTTYKFKDRGISIRVDREKFNKFPLFDTFKFTIQGGKRIPLLQFKISSKKSVYYYHRSRDKITNAEIIYSESNPKIPLVYGITSGGNTSYYKQSNVKDNTFFLALATRPSEDVADALIQENDKINNTITFRVDKKEKYSSIGRVNSKGIGGYYKEYTHEPATTRDHNKKSALVVNNVDGINEKVKFTGDSNINIQDNKLDGFSVYFYDFGSHKDTPLLVKVKMGSEQHFYEPTLGHFETWTKVDADKEMNGATQNTDITAYLDKIKKWLCETVYVSIHKQVAYRMLSVDDDETVTPVNKVPETQAKPGNTVQGPVGDSSSSKGTTKPGEKRNKPQKATPSRPTRLNAKNTINVTPKKCPTELGDYICFQHDLKVHQDATSAGFEKHEIGYGISKDIIVYISNVHINVNIVLPGGLGGYMGVVRDTKVEKVNFTFLQKHTMLNVFFYSPPEEGTAEGMDRDMATTSGTNTNPKQKHDHIPLMFNYYNHWFQPRSIDTYFYVWDRVENLNVPDPINCNRYEADKIKEHLDNVNRMLNRVKLNYNMNNSSMRGTATGTPTVVNGKPGPDQGGKGVSGPQVSSNTSDSSGKYGIPYPTYLNPSYNVDRINVTCTQFTDDPLFISYTHKSINGFGVGTTCYRTKEKEVKGPGFGGGQLTKVPGFGGPTFHGQNNHDNHFTKPNDRRILGIEEDLDGKVDVAANSVTVYFFNEDTNRNYPLLAEYDQGNNKYKYYVLKHGKDDNELASSQR